MALGMIVLTVPTSAAVLVESLSPDQAIPDNDLNGISSAITVSGQTEVITDIDVTLNLTASGGGAFNGDYYAYLTHDTIPGFAVLLNRPGRTAANALGTDGAGFSSVVFDDGATNGDVHLYESTLGAGFNAGDALSGVWAPDGRNVNPANVVATDSRTALLSSFHGQNPNGEWTLFVADVASGGTLTLSDWELRIEVSPVPEPIHYVALTGLSVAMVACRRGRSRWKKLGMRIKKRTSS